jgi:8-oxo-dGTP diphosphatase
MPLLVLGKDKDGVPIAVDEDMYRVAVAELEKQKSNTITRVAWAHIKDGKLLCVRSKGLDLFYNVGGKTETGETDIDALVREVKEEVGVDLVRETIRPMCVIKGPGVDKSAGKEIILKLFQGVCVGTPHIPQGEDASESAELKWVGRNEKGCMPLLGQWVVDWLVAHRYM